jgi:hypothetical protein
MSLPIQQHNFAYNTGSPISGTSQVGDLAVSSINQDYSEYLGGVQWWGGPNESNVYVIAVPVSGNTQPTPISGVTASLGFYKTSTQSDVEFISLSQFVSKQYGNPQRFSAATEASTWLTANGFWNNYGVSFTLSQSDFSNANWGTYISPLGNQNDGFTTTGQAGPGEAYYEPWLSLNNGGNTAKLSELRYFWSSNGLTTNTNAYMFNVTWGTGSTLTSGVAIVEFRYYDDNNASLNMGVVNTTDPVWQNSGTAYYDGPIYTLAGTWTFPATFTLIKPLIVNGQDWC